MKPLSMPRQPLLTADERHQLVEAARDSGLLAEGRRELLLLDLPAALVARLPRFRAPSDQIESDLAQLAGQTFSNEGVLAPLLNWLKSARHLTHPHPASRIFGEAIHTIEHRLVRLDANRDPPGSSTLSKRRQKTLPLDVVLVGDTRHQDAAARLASRLERLGASSAISLIGDSVTHDTGAHVTVVLISRDMGPAWYESRQIQLALRRVDRDGRRHRLVPVYLDTELVPESIPAEIRRFAGFFSQEAAGLATVAREIAAIVDGMRGTRPTPRYTSAEDRAYGEQLDELELAIVAGRQLGRDISKLAEQKKALITRMREGGTLRPGDWLGGYRLHTGLGQGGFAEVWQAYDPVGRRFVALKVLHTRYRRDESRVERFFRGARQMARLNHPNIVPVLEVHRIESNYAFFTMALVAGGNLEDAILTHRLQLTEALERIAEVAEGLGVAHRAGMVHRDVKPANILLTLDARAMLTDFDLVKASDTTHGTRTGALGTWAYAAPEQWDNPAAVTPAADVYGLGRTVLFALMGRHPPRRDAADFVRRRRTLQKLDADPAILDVVLRATAEDPSQRHADGSTFATALRQAIEVARLPVLDLEPLPESGVDLGMGIWIEPADDDFIDIPEQLPDETSPVRQGASAPPPPIPKVASPTQEAKSSVRSVVSREPPSRTGEQRGKGAAARVTAPPLPPRARSGSSGGTPDGRTRRSTVGDAPSSRKGGALSHSGARHTGPLTRVPRHAGAADSSGKDGSGASGPFESASLGASRIQPNRVGANSPSAAASPSIPHDQDVFSLGDVDLDEVFSTLFSSGDSATVAESPLWHPGEIIAAESEARPALVYIPAGDVVLGRFADIDDLSEDRATARLGLVNRPFLMAVTPHTQAQFCAIAGRNPSAVIGKNNPVERIRWHEAIMFCNALSVREGLVPAYVQSKGGIQVSLDNHANGYRLPTDVEWEYACRATTTTRFWSGQSDEELARVAWYSDNSGDRTHPVGQKDANPWGLFDMHGNVFEWCWDRLADVSRSVEEGASERVARGGSFFFSAAVAASAVRTGRDPGRRWRDVGFRIVRTL